MDHRMAIGTPGIGLAKATQGVTAVPMHGVTLLAKEGNR